MLAQRRERERERERERVHFFDFSRDRSGRQICRRNETTSHRERRKAVSERKRTCALEIEREPFHRERELTGWSRNENFHFPPTRFQIQNKRKKKNEIKNILHVNTVVEKLCNGSATFLSQREKIKKHSLHTHPLTWARPYPI
jgi:hypothetical protein